MFTKHEEKYRGDGAITKLSVPFVAIAGVGALGSNLADNLVRQGVSRLLLIDKDRVEESNIGTQRYGRSEIGAWKVEALRNQIYAATGVSVEESSKELTESTCRKVLKGANLVVDCFDNSASRRLLQEFCRKGKADLLHVGLFENYAEIIWDDRYTVPKDAEDGDVCDYPLARNIIMLAVSVASEVLVDFILTGRRRSFAITLRDLQVRML